MSAYLINRKRKITLTHKHTHTYTHTHTTQLKMGVRVVEADASDSNDDDCSTCCSGSSRTSSTSSQSCAKKQTRRATAKPKDYYYYDDGTAETLHPSAASSSSSRAKEPQSHFQHCAKDLVGNCKEFRIDVNRHDLRIIGNGNRVRIAKNTGNVQVVGNSTRLKILQNNGPLKYTGNDGRIYLGSDSQQQSVDYIGCNGILKVLKSAELQAQPKPCNRKSTNVDAANQSRSGVWPAFKSASFDGSQLQRGHIQQSIIIVDGNRVCLENKANNLQFVGDGTRLRPHAHTAESTRVLQNGSNTFGVSTSAQGRPNTGADVSNGSNVPRQRPEYRGVSMPNINLNASSAQFANKENRSEIRNNLTVINKIGGNIVIKNAVNVSI